MITTFIILLLIFIILKALTDIGYIDHDSKLWHSADAATRFILFSYLSINELGFNDKAYSTTILFLCFYWIGFDILINKARSLPIMYVGSGQIDLIIKKISSVIKLPPDWVMLLFKFIILISSIIYFILSWS